MTTPLQSCISECVNKNAGRVSCGEPQAGSENKIEVLLVPEKTSPVQAVKISRRIISNERGGANLRALLWVIFIAAVVYSAYLIAPPFIRYKLFKTEVEDEAKLAHLYDDDMLAKRMFSRAQAWDIPIDLEDIQLTRYKDEINVTVYYKVPIEVPRLYKRDLEYYIDVTEPVLEKSGTLKHEVGR